ncbi:hypothetical protein ABFS82_08G007900 [Erythranthe guttata]
MEGKKEEAKKEVHEKETPGKELGDETDSRIKGDEKLLNTNKEAPAEAKGLPHQQVPQPSDFNTRALELI